MGELRIDIKLKKVTSYRRDFIIAALLIIWPIIANVILLASGIRFFGLGIISTMAGVMILGVQLHFLWKIPLCVDMTDLGIYFQHWRNFTKSPKFIGWTNIESIFPANKIRLKDGTEKRINFFDRSDFDLILDFLVLHDLSHLIKGQYSGLMDYSKSKQRPNIYLTKKGRISDSVLWKISFLDILSKLKIIYPATMIEFSVSPDGVHFKKRNKDIFLTWNEISAVSSDVDPYEYTVYTISINSTDKRFIGFNDRYLDRRSHAELFWALNEYCLYYGIPVRDGAKHLKIKKKG